MTGKFLHDHEWVKIAGLRNKTFIPRDDRCEICHRLTCAVVWFSIKTKRVRCQECFKAQPATS